jgi:hypothetical protein
MPSSGILRFVTLVRTDIAFLCSILWLPVTTNDVPSSQMLVTLILVALRFSETSVLTGDTLHNIPEDAVLHSHSREDLKSYLTYNVKILKQRALVDIDSRATA